MTINRQLGHRLLCGSSVSAHESGHVRTAAFTLADQAPPQHARGISVAVRLCAAHVTVCQDVSFQISRPVFLPAHRRRRQHTSSVSSQRRQASASETHAVNSCRQHLSFRHQVSRGSMLLPSAVDYAARGLGARTVLPRTSARSPGIVTITSAFASRAQRPPPGCGKRVTTNRQLGHRLLCGSSVSAHESGHVRTAAFTLLIRLRRSTRAAYLLRYDCVLRT
eukprot:COSAG01_NODE_70_length_28755_cov_34.709067_16_plen_222_part_00